MSSSPAVGHGRRADPSPWIARWAGVVPAGARVLDLACGGGRHGRLFRQRGHPVTFLDRDTTGVADLDGADGVEIVAADLEAPGAPWPLADRAFGAVVVVNYLWRPVLPRILAAVAPGGLLLYDTFMAGNEAFGRPRNPDFLLRPGELREAAGEAFDVIEVAEGEVREPAPAMRQRLAARRVPGA